MLEVKEMIISEEMAKEYLAKNTVNRTLNAKRVKQYAADMKEGLWQFNGEAIKFYEDGSLADGQHRLSGVIESHVPLHTVVIFGLPRDVTVQDRGRNRTIPDSMKLEGFSPILANNLTVGMAKLHAYVQFGKSQVSDGYVKTFITNNSDTLSLLFDSVPKRGGGRTKRFTVNIKNAPILLACFYALNCHACEIDTITKFLDIVATGFSDNTKQSSAIVCRNDLLSGSMSTHTAKSRKRTVFQVEKALSDFISQYPRKISYSSWKEPIYSNNICNANA